MATAQPDLDVWMNGEFVGTWFFTRTGTSGFRYGDSWLQSPHVRPLSLSLPIPAGEKEVRGPVVEHYFDNLLPDSSRIRERIRRRFGTASTRAADLLAAIGRDCVGAVQLVPAGSDAHEVQQVRGEPLTPAGVEAVLRGVTSDTPQAEPGRELRISLAGAQEKTALLRIGRRWHRPLGPTPTTHIFKLPLGLVGNMRADMSTSVENEWLCVRLLTAMGLPTAQAQIGRFGAQKVLIVERFDRMVMDGGAWIARLPQEDFCQALGLPAELKYESDGGPGMRAALALLSGSVEPLADKLRFVLAQLAFWLLAATDGHAKNFSIHLLPGGSFRLTPLYDVLSAWPIIGTGPNQVSLRRAKLAMALRSKNTHYHLHEIRAAHWRTLAAQSGVPDAFDRMTELVETVPMALERTESKLPADFPRTIFNALRHGMLAQAGKFLHGRD